MDDTGSDSPSGDFFASVDDGRSRHYKMGPLNKSLFIYISCSQLVLQAIASVIYTCTKNNLICLNLVS